MNRNDQEFILEKIRTQYTEKQASPLDELKALDAKVKRPALVFSYIFGSLSAIVMGSGMSLVMVEDLAEKIGMTGDPMIPGVIIGGIGLILAIINYPLHKVMLNARKKKYAPEILKLSKKIMEEQTHEM